MSWRKSCWPPRRDALSPLPPLPIQYADYAAWQHESLQGPLVERELAYWEQRLRGLPPLSLPTVDDRPAIQRHQGASHHFVLGEALTTGLRRVGRGHGATLFMTLMAAWQTLLSRYSGQQDFGVGVLVANRGRVELEDLIGLFLNTLVLRADLAGDPSFLDVVERVRTDALAAYAHQTVPFQRVVERLGGKRDLGRNPLFQVLFVLENTPEVMGSRGEDGVTVTPLPVPNTTSDFDLTLLMKEVGTGLQGELEYNTGLFTAAYMEKMARDFERLLHAVVLDPGARLSALLPHELSPEVQRERPALRHLEREVLSIWEEVLNVAPVSRHDDFFALGRAFVADVAAPGDARAQARVRASLGRPLPRGHARCGGGGRRPGSASGRRRPMTGPAGADIERRALPGRAEFERRYQAQSQPVIFTDVVPRWPAHSRWTFAWLREAHGQRSVTVGDAHAEFEDEPPTRSLASYLDAFGGASHPGYLGNVALDRIIPELRADFAFPTFWRLPPIATVRYWIGPANTLAQLHRDFADNGRGARPQTRHLARAAPRTAPARDPPHLVLELQPLDQPRRRRWPCPPASCPTTRSCSRRAICSSFLMAGGIESAALPPRCRSISGG